MYHNAVHTSFDTIRTVQVHGQMPCYYLEDILKFYPINIEGEAYASVRSKFVSLWSADIPVEVVGFDGFAVLVALCRYQVGGDLEDYRKFLSYMENSQG